MLKVGILGCGRIAKKHADIFTQTLTDKFQLIAACDINKNKVLDFAETYKIQAFCDYREMMRDSQIDLIVICTESGNHANHVIELATFKKHIVVEKPMALSLDDADKMIEAADFNGIKLFVVKQNRFNKPILKLKEVIDAGGFGDIFMCSIRVRWCRKQSYYDQDAWRGTWKLDGGVLANQAIHHIDMMQWLCGPIDEVFAKGDSFMSKIEAEDTAVAVLRFSSGALGLIEATTAVRPKDIEGSISVLGSCGTAVVGGFAMNKIEAWQFENQDLNDDEVIESYSENPPNVYGFGHIKYYEHVYSCIKNNGNNLIDGLEGKKSLQILTALYESIASKQPIQLRPLSNKTLLGK